MPDYPPIDALQQAVQRRILPTQAGEASPVALRALANVAKQYPADMMGVRVHEMPMTDRHAFSNTLASTTMKGQSRLGNGFTEHDPEEIMINPGVTAVFPQAQVEGTLAHELEHIRQNRTGDPEIRHYQHMLPYESQPDEIAAFKSRRVYDESHPQPSTTALESLRRFLPAIQRLF